MTNEQILEQQVEALEKLLKLKQAIVEELEAKVQRLQSNPRHGGYGGGGTISYPPGQQWGGAGGYAGHGAAQAGVQIWPNYGAGGGGGGSGGTTIVSDLCPIGPTMDHDYPLVGASQSTQPCCKKCGRSKGSLTGTITSTGGSSGSIIAPTGNTITSVFAANELKLVPTKR